MCNQNWKTRLPISVLVILLWFSFPVRLNIGFAMYLFQMCLQIIFSIKTFTAIWLFTLKWFFRRMWLEMTLDMFWSLEPQVANGTLVFFPGINFVIFFWPIVTNFWSCNVEIFGNWYSYGSIFLNNALKRTVWFLRIVLLIGLWFGFWSCGSPCDRLCGCIIKFLLLRIVYWKCSHGW